MILPVLAFGPIVMAFVSYLTGRFNKTARNWVVGFTGILTFAGCLSLWSNPASFTVGGFCGFGLNLKADGFRSLYAAIAAFMWMMTGLFSPEYFAHYHNRNRYYFFNLLTLGATIGVFLSDDLYTTLIFFEVMSLASYPWVAHEETPAAMKAAGTYLAVAVIGGLTTLMGLFLLYHELGTLTFDGMKEAIELRGNSNGIITAASWLTVFGFAAKAGMFPLHIWLPKAHPVAPAPASALLSGILTKSGVFGLIVVCSRLMSGNAAFGNMLLIFAAITMFLGALLALLSIDLKRTLACSSMSQIGFIGVGLSIMVLLGEEGSLPAYGAVMHMMNHSLIKLVLFMSAGVVYMNLHKLNLNDIRGFGRGKPVLHIAFLLGALSIGCLPFVGSGFASKSLLHEGILEYIEVLEEEGIAFGAYRFLEYLFIFSGGLTIAYMTKLYICLFWEKHPTRQAEFDAKNKHYINVQSSFVLLISAIVLPALAIFPSVFMTPVGARSAAFFGQEPLAHTIEYFSGENLIGAFWSILVGSVVYLLVVRPLLMKREGDHRVYVDRKPAWLDLEELVYRPLLMKLLPAVTGAVTHVIASLPDYFLKLGPVVVAFVRFLAELPEYIALFFRGSLFRKLKAEKRQRVGSRTTYAAGRLLDRISAFLNTYFRHGDPIELDFEYRLDASHQARTENKRRIYSSISFGITMLGIGLCAACLYLLLK